jgi:hypothetical protein
MLFNRDEVFASSPCDGGDPRCLFNFGLADVFDFDGVC